MPPDSAIFAIVVAISLGIAGTALWRSQHEREVLLNLSPEVRLRVYRGALATFSEMCPDASLELELDERCQREAEFLSEFPECDEHCIQLVRRSFPQPTR